MNNLIKKIETVANIAIILVAILICFVIVKKYFLQEDNQLTEPKSIVGKKVSLSDVNWSTQDKSLIVYVKKGCHFCSESASFYQKLVNVEVSENKNFQLIAVVQDEIEEGKNYLKELGVNINDVKQASLNSIGVIGTPALLLVNRSGFVTDIWVGKLSSEKETEVLNKISNCSNCN